MPYWILLPDSSDDLYEMKKSKRKPALTKNFVNIWGPYTQKEALEIVNETNKIRLKFKSIDINKMTKKQLANYIVKNLRFRTWVADFAYGNALLAYRLSKMNNKQLVEFLIKYDKGYLIEIIEES